MQDNQDNDSTATPESISDLITSDTYGNPIILTRAPRFRVVTDPIRPGSGLSEKK